MSSAASSHDLGPGELRLGRPLVSNLVTAVVVSGQGLLLLLSLVLFVRWLGGALSAPPPALVLLAAVAVSAAAVAFRFWLVLGISYSVPSDGAIVLFAAPGVASLLLLTALTLPGSQNLPLALAWLIALAVEAASWLLFYRRVSRPVAAAPALPALVSAGATETRETRDADVFQELTRTRQADGSETLSATVRIDFPVGDRLQIVHLAFCPPLDQTPQLEVEQQDGAEVELRTTLVQTFGARIEARLTEASDEPQSAVVQIYAATEPGDEPAE